MPKPLEVTITVGTSFSIGGAFENPDKFKPIAERSVLCDGNGLDFMLDTFDQYKTNASFFIECANHYYFGDGPMKSIVDKIQAHGQDTQLMINPGWFYYDKSASYSQNDSCVERDYAELKTIVEKSIAAFKRMTGKKPDAIRTGNCQIDKQVYKIMAELDIAISSSIGQGIFRPDGKDMLLYSGRTKVDGIMEVPIFTYSDKDVMGRFPSKTLQITSCSWPEMKYILEKARKTGIENIVLVSQPFDYIKKRDNRYLEITKNRVNQSRLQKLCAYIAEHDQDFTTVDFGSQADQWKSLEQENIKNFKIPTRYRNGRKLQNLINDLFWNY
ncbi:MAG: hypothetical protein HN572_11645 [Kordiimonadaceae bacterium]|nr:hypothetical protein [Kordiimonadaceae bacterium]